MWDRCKEFAEEVTGCYGLEGAVAGKNRYSFQYNPENDRKHSGKSPLLRGIRQGALGLGDRAGRQRFCGGGAEARGHLGVPWLSLLPQ